MSIHVGRFINRESAHFNIEVLTPMFLGGAEGNAELRSPPFKNAFRYWWRLTQGDLSSDKLLAREQSLFGGVNEGTTLNMKPVRSRVDIVLKGDVQKDTQNNRINIGNKINPEANGKNVSLGAYIGMGPVNFHGNYEKTPILPGETFSLSITWPRENRDEILDAISMFAHFGGLGSRSRNGWGSIQLSAKPADNTDETMSGSPVSAAAVKLRTISSLYERYGQEITEVFQKNKNKKYPFKLGFRGTEKPLHPLLWKIASGSRWQEVMQAAAEQYMDARQVLKFPKNSPSGVQKRHIAGYPVTGHTVREWGGYNGRMPSQLRIIIRRHGDQYTSYFFHLPHQIPKRWDNKLGSELSVWEEIHGWLDKNCSNVIL